MEKAPLRGACHVHNLFEEKSMRRTSRRLEAPLNFTNGFFKGLEQGAALQRPLTHVQSCRGAPRTTGFYTAGAPLSMGFFV